MEKSKRICVRFGLQELQDLTWLQMNGGGWDPSVIIRRAVKQYRQHLEQSIVAEQKLMTEFLSGKMNGNGKAKAKKLAKGAKRHTV